MKRLTQLLFAVFCFAATSLMAQEGGGYAADYASGPRFRALLHYEPHAEEAHVEFDKQAIKFFHKLTYGEGWLMDVTTSLADYPLEKLKEYSIIISLNAMP
ncbi:MAG: ThuA domain-containing protein, partial [Bacteroidaceae bacterium]|nr:ThuA domain-containing protein [Bacteroidaceae bacterium]